MDGNQALCRALEELGVSHVFGLPGTQNVGLFEALRTSRLRAVLATHEAAAAFMANGYARTSGGVGVLVTIPGPGFTWALPGLAEARLDSAAVLHVVGQPATGPGRRFQHQAINQEAIAAPLVKRVFNVSRPDEVSAAVKEAHAEALAGEPGPVVLHLAAEALSGTVAPTSPGETAVAAAVPDDAEVAGTPGTEELAALLLAARRPVVFAGAGAACAASDLERLVDRLDAPLFTTPSGRGVLPEDHPLALGLDLAGGGLAALNELLADSDLVLALGCKLAHNGTDGFRLALTEDQLVHVNSDRGALGANYAARLAIHARVEEVLADLLPRLDERSPAASWTRADIAGWRARFADSEPPPPPEPRVHGLPEGSMAGLFALLGEALPRDTVLVTDSGLHQMLARRHHTVLAPRGLLLPSDFQSMGFGLPAAIGAKLAAPERPVVAVIGDGGLALSGMELLTLAREQVPLVVVVFNDGYLNLIRLQQIRDHGHTHAVRLRNPDMEALAAALGVDYALASADLVGTVRGALAAERPLLLEVRVGDSPDIRALRATGTAKSLVRRAIGRRLLDRIRHLLGR